jgi:hypothetical protein
VICGCCGGVATTEEIIADAADDGVDADHAIIELEWLDIDEAITG